MTSIYCRCMLFDAILKGKGSNSVERNMIVHGAMGTTAFEPWRC